MTVPGSANPLLTYKAAAGGISRSIRLNAPDSAYLSRTPASAGNRTTWTWAGWVKRSDITTNARQVLFSADGGANDTNYFEFGFGGITDLTSSIYWSQWTVAANSAAAFRDPSAWYHVVANYNGTNLTFYVNNVQVLQSAKTGNLGINGAWEHGIGRNANSGGVRYFSGYLADIYFIDGQALTPSSFTETDATTGQLIPKAFSGSYGSQGWHLEFADNSSNTATTLGKDTSGNGNNFTPNNLSVTAGAGNDSLVDVPTNGSEVDSGIGGEVRGNYCCLNPLDLSANISLTNGNLNAAVASGTSSKNIRSTIFPSSGKWYWEMTNTTVSTFTMIGIASRAVSLTSGAALNQTGGYAYGSDGNFYIATTVDSTPASFTSGDVIGCAWDIGAGTLQFYKNGVSQGTISSVPSGEYSPAFTVTSGSDSIVVNFGARPFAYTAPSGFKALCTANITTPLVVKPSTVMDVVLYTGTGSSLTLPYASSTPTSIAFTPDLVWIKGRSGATDHALYDAVRDVQKDLASNSTAAETTQSTGLTAFGTNTFTIGSLAKLNTSSATYAAWCWDAGSSTDTNNTAGTITPTGVRANPTAGFSIVTYTGNGSSGATVGHGLGVSPGLVIVKGRSSSSDWPVWHSSLTATTGTLWLNLTVGQSTYQNRFDSTGMSSTVFKFGTTIGEQNTNGTTYVAYCFAPVVGYSNAFTYTGNGSSDGPMVWLGFRPRLILIKRSDGGTNYWSLIDTARNTYNVANAVLYPNASDAESTTNFSIDILSNGFKIRATSSDVNVSSGTYIGFAWAESPFNYARAR